MIHKYGNLDWIEAAKAAYKAYGDSVGWKNFQGNPMPQWADLPEHIQIAWRFACYGAAAHIFSIPLENLYDVPLG